MAIHLRSKAIARSHWYTPWAGIPGGKKHKTF